MVVYAVGGPRLRNVTRLYGASLDVLPGRAPRRVDVGNPLTGYLLGPTWYPHAVNHRWMPQQATLRVGGPRSAAERLYISGHCPAAMLRSGPLEMTASADGEILSTVTITHGDAGFAFGFALPPRLLGKPVVEIEIRVNRTQQVSGRDLGLAFGVFEIR